MIHAGNFIVNLPKVRSVAEVAEFAKILHKLEEEFAIDEHALRFEIMIETPQIVLGADGRSPLPLLVGSGRNAARCRDIRRLRFAPARSGITAAHQSAAPSRVRVRAQHDARRARHVERAIVGRRDRGASDRRQGYGARSVESALRQRAPRDGRWILPRVGICASRTACEPLRRDVCVLSRGARCGRGAAQGIFSRKAEQATRVGSARSTTLRQGTELVNFSRLAVSCGAMTMEEVTDAARHERLRPETDHRVSPFQNRNSMPTASVAIFSVGWAGTSLFAFGAAPVSFPAIIHFPHELLIRLQSTTRSM